MLFAFNLLVPCWPLDGGRIFASALVLCKVDRVKVAWTMVVLSALIGVGLCITAIVIKGWMLTGLVALYLLYQTYRLWSAIQNNRLDDYPLFAREPSEHHDSSSGRPIPPASL